MQAFYSSSFINSVTSSTADERINVKIFNFNIEHLLVITEARLNNTVVPSFTYDGTIKLLDSSTVKKISKRSNQSPQVQISKLREDGAHFLHLRSSLFTDDLLIFLQYRGAPDSYLVIGIPSTSLSNQTTNYHSGFIASNYFTDEINTQQIPHSPFQISLREVTAENIASYTSSQSNGGNQLVFDLSNGIRNLANRTERHQDIVRNLALLLESQNFSLYAGNIDCLATKENSETLIFEVKTLDGSPTDETNQVRNALSQLLYYERFATSEFASSKKLKFAFFESKISDDHIQFLENFGILVIWLENELLVGSEEAIYYLNTISIN